jgi:hypothetical protein
MKYLMMNLRGSIQKGGVRGSVMPRKIANYSVRQAVYGVVCNLAKTISLPNRMVLFHFYKNESDKIFNPKPLKCAQKC